ncbi:MAG: hypothetical protein HC901_04315 [Bdellovibrionaceae bacterium]|nr:hypothetical protein [Pseudobdellovibrionaceae bacterium]
MTTLDRYIQYYTQAIRGFVDAVGEVNAANIPEPHLPLWGRGYDQANPKILFIGEETRGWRNGADEFLKIARKNPAKALDCNLEKNEIDSLKFIGWAGRSGRDFWGTVFRLLALIHGLNGKDDWKRFKCKDIDQADSEAARLLRSFAWANTNAVEQHTTLALADPTVRNHLRIASASHLDSLTLLLDVFQPDVAIIMNWIGFPEGYWGRELHWNWFASNIKHLAYTVYEGNNYKTHIFKTAHPTYLHRRKLHDKVLEAIESKWQSLRASAP